MAGIDKINKIKAKAIPQIVKAFKKAFSVDAKIFYPTENSSIYGSHDSEFTYNEIPDDEDEFLISGIFGKHSESFNTLAELDPFFDEDSDKKLYDNNEKVIPINSMIEVIHDDVHLKFKISSAPAQVFTDEKISILNIYKLTPIG